MLSQDLTCLIHIISFWNVYSRSFFNISCIILIRNETNFHTVRFFCNRKFNLPCNFPNLVLCISTQRHNCARKLLLCQSVKRICLILCRGNGAFKRKSSIWKLCNLRVMTSCNILCPQLFSLLHHCLPFNITIADNTWIRSSPGKIFFCKIINDCLFKLRAKIHYMVRNPQKISNISCISGYFFPCVSIAKIYHCHTDHVISLFFQEISCHRGVHSS